LSLQFIIENWGYCPKVGFFGDKLTVKMITGLKVEKFNTKFFTFSCRSVLGLVATKSKGKEIYVEVFLSVRRLESVVATNGSFVM
jgi:hypothetical protein